MTATALRPAASLEEAAGRPQQVPGFTDAMSALAGGVVLVTCEVDRRPWGMTATAFASVSADPPTVLVSLGSGTTSARGLVATGRFGVSILAEEQLAVARLGAEPGATKFLEHVVEPGGRSPAVAGALAHLDCEVVDAMPVADHLLFIGRVVGARASLGGRPLVYHGRAYRTLCDRAARRRRIARERACLSS